MIVQSAPTGEPRFAITMDEHTTLAGEFARAFGNEKFAPPEPRELMLYVVDNHDKGWRHWDAAPKTDARSGLPYNLIDTPIVDITGTSAGSPDYNETRHAYCGLLSSMHSWGLYNGRYGMSSKVLIDGIAPAERPLAVRMLDGELRRQERLRRELARDSRTSPWLEESRLFQNYKLLQFFDTLALYFNRYCVGERGLETFEHVPKSPTCDVSIKLRPLADGRYAVAPFPFSVSPLTLRFSGRYIRAVGIDEQPDWAEVLAQTPISWQQLVLVNNELL